MKQTTKKAVVATIRYAGFEFSALKLPNGSYAIGAIQIAEIFQFDQNQGSRAIKRLLGKGFQFDRVASELHPKKVNIVLLEDFGRLVNAVSRERGTAWSRAKLRRCAIARSKDKAYEKAREIAFAIQDASVTTTLEMAFDIGFNNKQKLEDYQAKHEARVQGKVTRRTLTNAIRDYINANADDLSPNYQKFVYNNCL